MPAIPIIAAVGATVAAGATVVSAIEAGKSRKAAQKQYQYERQLSNNRAAKERSNTIRAARMQSGALAQTAANSGAGESSIALGALGSIQTQLNSSLSFLDTNQKLSNLAGFQASKAAIARSKSDTWAGVSQVGMQIFGQAGGFNAFGK